MHINMLTVQPINGINSSEQHFLGLSVWSRITRVRLLDGILSRLSSTSSESLFQPTADLNCFTLFYQFKDQSVAERLN